MMRYPRFARPLGLLRPYKVRFALATAALFLGSALSLAYPQAARYAVDLALGHGDTGRLNQLALALMGVFVVHAALTWARHYWMSWLGERIVADLRQQVFDKMLALPPSWYHERRTGELVGRLASDVTTIQSAVGSELSITLRNLVQLVGGVVLLFIQNAALTVWMLLVVPPLTLGVVVFGRRIRKMSRVLQDRLADASAHVQEAVAGIRTVQAFGRERHESASYARNVGASFFQGLRLARWRASFFAAVAFITYFVIAIILWLGGNAVARGELTGGELIAFFMYTTIVAVALAGLAGSWRSIMGAAGATERIYEIIDAQPGIADPADPEPLPAGRGAIRIADVDFHYPSRPQAAVLRGVSLDVAPGEVVALVGASGAGKTTLTSLVMRFHDVTRGSVTFEGVDVRLLRLADLRGAIAIVDQEPLLFSGSVRDNIAYGADRADTELIERAARDARAHDFISAFPAGYDTLVGERGVKLSVGQKQRVAIARAIVRDPRVLILDEATSNLDAENEALVQEALARLMNSRTTLVIAHRLSTVRSANRIVVLDAGQVVEVGPHDELMARRGVYRRLVERQVIIDPQ